MYYVLHFLYQSGSSGTIDASKPVTSLHPMGITS